VVAADAVSPATRALQQRATSAGFAHVTMMLGGARAEAA
jgi:hypothetical protein